MRKESMDSLKDVPDEDRIPRHYEQHVSPRSKALNGVAKPAELALMELVGLSSHPRGKARAAPESVRLQQTIQHTPVQQEKVAEAQEHIPATLEESLGIEEEFDIFSGSPEKKPEIPESELLAEKRPLATPIPVQRDLPPQPVVTKPEVIVKPSKFDEFFNGKDSVQFNINDGMLALPVINISISPYCLTLIVSTSDSMVFIPKLGSRVTVVHGEQEYPCYYPGTYCCYNDLGIGILMFMRDNDE